MVLWTPLVRLHPSNNVRYTILPHNPAVALLPAVAGAFYSPPMVKFANTDGSDGVTEVTEMANFSVRGAFFWAAVGLHSP